MVSESVTILGDGESRDLSEERMEMAVSEKLRELQAEGQRFCPRCFLDSDGKVRNEVTGDFCGLCGTKWNRQNEVNP